MTQLMQSEPLRIVECEVTTACPKLVWLAKPRAKLLMCGHKATIALPLLLCGAASFPHGISFVSHLCTIATVAGHCILVHPPISLMGHTFTWGVLDTQNIQTSNLSF